jgi:tetratricopeptide (TPR) repeat protein
MNAVHLEMVKMGRKWKQEVNNNPEAISYVLLGQKPQNQLFETFFKYQLAEEGNSNDLYLLYYQPFNDEQTYGASLLQELKYVYEEFQKENPGSKNWIGAADPDNAGAEEFINKIIAFTEMYPALQRKKMFIHLAPTSISDRKEFETWIAACGKQVEKLETENIKLVFTDHESHRTINHFYKPHFWNFPIDISKLMENTAESTNQKKGAKENNFQQLILKAGNLLGKQQFADADIILDTAIKVAVQNKYNQGTVMAKLLKAQNYQAQAKNDAATAAYNQAVQDAGKDKDMLVQVYFSYGAFLLSQKQKKKALQLFDEVNKIGAEKNDIFLQIEAHRLIGQLSDSRFGSVVTVSNYEKCIALGKNLPAAELKETSLPYIASLLLKKYGRNSVKGLALQETMAALFGNGWEKLVLIPELNNRKK